MKGQKVKLEMRESMEVENERLCIARQRQESRKAKGQTRSMPRQVILRKKGQDGLTEREEEERS